ncbi:MAG: YggS family pyridoxal phosphate-dependent enzyme [Epulopiscium sp.]|nr:YggS family pyridoxal phosphate-dependent enzyme [Candidatus Epulonipiscium sp.]
MSLLEHNIKLIHNKIQDAVEKVNRKAEDITIIGVTKTVPVSQMKASFQHGITHMGENRVQEFMNKYNILPEEIHWHFIGHLQRNKVKDIIDKVELIHSVDSYRLVEQINKEAQKASKVMDILLQINIAEEETKFGFTIEEVHNYLPLIKRLPFIRVQGLMAIPPYVENPEENRNYFKTMKNLFIDIKDKNIDNINMEVLSMGMTNDYEVAIEEGATMIRIGSGLYGDRLYVKDK